MNDIIVLGGIKGKVVINTKEQLMLAQQNPGVISVSYSGTGRNIAENLGRMGASVSLVAAAGDDFTGKGASEELAAAGVNTDHIFLAEGQNTAMNVAVFNIIGDMDFAVDNIDVYQCLKKEQIDEAMDCFENAKLVCADGTLSEEVLHYLAQILKCPLFFDPHTQEDAVKAKKIIGSFHTIKPNRAEASVLCGKEIFSEEQLMEAGAWFAEQGVKRIFITLSGGGVYYKEGIKEGIIRPKEVLPFTNEEGGGDAFSAALLEGTLQGMDVESLAAYGMKAAAIALECRQAVNPSMSRKRMEEE